MKYEGARILLAAAGWLAAGIVSAGAFNYADFERSGGMYKETLDAFYESIMSGDAAGERPTGSVGIMETVRALGQDEALRRIGFAIEDVSGDGTPELLIGGMPDSGKNLYAVYTMDNGAPMAVFDGWARNAYYMLGKNLFYYSGSGGAAYSAFGTFRLSYDGTRKEWEDFYFSDIKDESRGTIGYFYNQSGIWNKEDGEELLISNDRFFEISDSLRAKVEPIEMIPFSDYGYDGKEPVIEDGVRADWAEDVVGSYADYDEFMADTSDYRVRILFSTDETVRDFKVLGLVPQIDEAGNMTFSETELYYMEQLTAERPFVLGMTFEGDTPNYGISYTDGNGRTRKFSIGLSGMDSSILLEEF